MSFPKLVSIPLTYYPVPVNIRIHRKNANEEENEMKEPLRSATY